MSTLQCLNAHLAWCLNWFLTVKAIVLGAFNKKKVPEGAFCIYMHCEILNFVKVRWQLYLRGWGPGRPQQLRARVHGARSAAHNWHAAHARGELSWAGPPRTPDTPVMWRHRTPAGAAPLHTAEVWWNFVESNLCKISGRVPSCLFIHFVIDPCV